MREEALRPHVLRMFTENFEVCDVRRYCRQVLREGFEAARCTASILLRPMKLQGVIHGRAHHTTFGDDAAPFRSIG